MNKLEIINGQYFIDGVEMVQKEKMFFEYQKAALECFNQLKCTLTKDGDQWCVLWGKDLQVGQGFFGNNPEQTIMKLYNWFRTGKNE